MAYIKNVDGGANMKLWVRTGKQGGVGTEYSGVSEYNLGDNELLIVFQDGTKMKFPREQVFSVTEVKGD